MVGHLAEPVAGRQVVVEVLAAGAHAADVQRQLRFRPSQSVVDVVADGQRSADHDVERSQCRIALGIPGPQRLAPHLVGLLGIEEHRLPALGDLGGQLDVLRAQRRDRDRNAVADRMIDQLQRLAEAGAPVGGQRNLVVLAVDR